MQVRQPDGLTAIDGRLKRGTVRADVGQQVSARDALGVVGSAITLMDLVVAAAT